MREQIFKMILLLIFVTICVGVFRHFFPRVVVEHEKPIVVIDSGAVDAAIKTYQDIIVEKDGFIARLLQTHKEGVPTISIGRPPVSPLAGTVIRETVYVGGQPISIPQKYYGYDFPISLSVSDDEVSITTINPLIEKNGGRYAKEYSYVREGDNFRLALNETNDEASLNGIRLIFDRKPVAWKGLSVGGAFGFPATGYGYVKARIEFYSKVSLMPEVRTTETPIWLLLEYKVN